VNAAWAALCTASSSPGYRPLRRLDEPRPRRLEVGHILFFSLCCFPSGDRRAGYIRGGSAGRNGGIAKGSGGSAGRKP
jgi:hypothetical protein